MTRTLVVVKELPEHLRERIRTTAEQHGFQPLFFSSVRSAADALREAEVVLGYSPRIPSLAPNLKWFCTTFAGIDLLRGPDVFPNPEVLVSNSSGAYGVTISEHIIMVTLYMLRKLGPYEELVHSHVWKNDLPVSSIKGAHITLLGTGDIGTATAKRLRAFEPASIIGVNRSGICPDAVYDSFIPAQDMDDVLGNTDILISSLPGTPYTKGLLSAHRLSLLHDQALIVNVGRGIVIDQAALVQELQNGRLLAALDVFETEPIPEDDPLYNCPNLLITPHCSGNMSLPYTVERVVDLFLEDFERYCKNEPLLREVDLKIGY